MIFDYVNNFADKQPKVCLYDIFKNIVRSEHVRNLIERFRAGDAEAKKQLPAFLFHATFNGKQRLAKNATASGLVMVDFDHVSDEDLQAFRTLLSTNVPQQWNIMLAHITPSGKGLRLVIRAEHNNAYQGCTTIHDFQKRLAQLMGAENYLDEVTTDLSRLSFAPMESDILLLSTDLFTAEKAMDFKDTEKRTDTQQTTAVFTTPSNQATYDGVLLTDIFRLYFETIGGIPAEGNRNAAFYSAARDLRYICDFNPQVVASAMPEVGLTQKEVLDVCASACASSRATNIPLIVRSCVDALKNIDEPEEVDEPEQSASAVKLPPVFQHFARCYPANFRDAVVMAMLPCLGTLGTRVRARYLDGELHSPSFFTVVSAEQASGKSFARRIVGALMEDLKTEDDANRVVEQAYRNALRQSKNKKQQPEDPRVVIRCVPANVSVAKLLQRMDYADGQHLFSFAEEMDTVIKANSGGSWSQKSDIYRNAFDNAEYGQDYMSDNSYSANLRIFYNMLVLGTPRQTNKFFSDVENGLVSRCMFASLPDGFASRMPVFKEITPEGIVYVKKFVQNLRDAKDVIDLSDVNTAIDEWLEAQRIQALKDADRPRDIFRKRAAVIGFRAAMILAAGSGKRRPQKKVLQDFAIYIATLVLEGQLAFAGARMEEALEENTPKRERRSQTTAIFNSLPEQFTITDLTAMVTKVALKTPARQLIYFWTKNNLVEKVAPKTFKKL